MKNMIFIGSTLLFIGTSAFSQSEMAYNDLSEIAIHKSFKTDKANAKELKKEKRSTTPNYAAEQHFLRDFPNATDVSWNTNGIAEATFMQNGKMMTGFYDYDNDLIGTTSKASYDDLRASARKYIEKHFNDYTTGTVILFDDNEYNDSPMELYETSFDGEDNYFVELVNNNKKIVLQVGRDGLVSFFKDISNDYTK
jgi:hypothetical protein